MRRRDLRGHVRARQDIELPGAAVHVVLDARGELHRGHHGAAGEVDYALGGDAERDVDPSAAVTSAYADQLAAEGRLRTTLEPPDDVRAIFGAARAGDAAVLTGALAVGLRAARDNVFVNRIRTARRA